MSRARVNEELLLRINFDQPAHEPNMIMPLAPKVEESKFFFDLIFFSYIANHIAFHITVADEPMNEEEQQDEEMRTPSRLTRFKNAVNQLINGVHGMLNLLGGLYAVYRLYYRYILAEEEKYVVHSTHTFTRKP